MKFHKNIKYFTLLNPALKCEKKRHKELEIKEILSLTIVYCACSEIIFTLLQFAIDKKSRFSRLVAMVCLRGFLSRS